VPDVIVINWSNINYYYLKQSLTHTGLDYTATASTNTHTAQSPIFDVYKTYFCTYIKSKLVSMKALYVYDHISTLGSLPNDSMTNVELR